MNDFKDNTLRDLLASGVITGPEVRRLERKLARLLKKADKARRQEEVNAEVEAHLMMITPGELFKHRKVWEAVGRESATRDEVLQALQFHKTRSGLVKQVRKGPNNFQVFWARCGDKPAESTEEEAS